MRSLVCGIAALAITGLQAPPVRAQTPLPAVEFRLSCFDDGAEQTAAEIEGLLALHEFARAHDAEVVWLDAVIAADAGAGGCSRDVSAFPDQPGPSGERARIVIQPCVDEPRAEACGGAERMIRVTANGPPLAYAHAIQLPDTDSLGDDLPYRHGGYGDWLNYQGPFIVRFFEGTGYAFVTFHAPHPALPGVWERARCNARPEACER